MQNLEISGNSETQGVAKGVGGLGRGGVDSVGPVGGGK